ncbi:MAG: rRNA maturation RNase YbeY [Lachnospiraceae bacterium]|nr:rRNA maturation RNase YbeY [Lachnospiraceae bacterium]
MLINYAADVDYPDFDYEKDIPEVIKKVVELEGIELDFEINLTFTDNETIKGVNKEFRGIDSATDVLSFPTIDFESPADMSFMEDELTLINVMNMDTQCVMLGDIMISVERAKEQALEYGHSLRREICFLVAHSTLHLLGYDHMTEEEAKIMEEKQENALKALGINRD